MISFSSSRSFSSSLKASPSAQTCFSSALFFPSVFSMEAQAAEEAAVLVAGEKVVVMVVVMMMVVVRVIFEAVTGLG